MYSKDCFSGFVFFFGLSRCLSCFCLKDFVFFPVFLLFSFCCVFVVSCLVSLRFSCFLLHFHVFSLPGGSWWVLRTSSDVLGELSGLSCGPLGHSYECLGAPWGVLGCPGAVLVRPWGITRASLWGSWGSLGRSGGYWGVLSTSLGDPVGDLGAPYATQTDVSAFRIFLC